jgi:hypothetical protein
MDDVDYAAIAVRNVYEAAGIRNPDFDRVVTFFETLKRKQPDTVASEGNTVDRLLG